MSSPRSLPWITRADLYLARGAALYALGGLLLLLGLFLLGMMVDQLGDLGQGNYTLGHLLQYLALSTPKIVYDIMPLAMLLGVMAFLSILAGHSEIVPLRMAGWSLSRLARPLWLVAALAGSLVLLLGELVVPYTSPWADLARAGAMDPNRSMALVGGEIWLKEGAALIHIERAESEGQVLRGVQILESHNLAGVDSILSASSAHYVRGGWQLQNVNRQTLHPDRVALQHMPSWMLNSAITPKTLRSFAHHPEAIPLVDVWRARQSVQGDGLKANRLNLVMWRRLSYPLVSFIMVALALPFAVRGYRGGGVAGQLLIGLSLGLAFHFLNQMGGYVSVAGGIAPWVSVIAPLLLFAGVAGWLLLRAR